jgi:hypothetical protein
LDRTRKGPPGVTGLLESLDPLRDWTPGVTGFLKILDPKDTVLVIVGVKKKIH